MPRIPFNKLEGSDRTDYCFRVYKEMCDQNASPDMTPFPMGIDRMRFPSYRIMIKGQDGGMYQGPTIEALIAKVLKAHVVTYFDA